MTHRANPEDRTMQRQAADEPTNQVIEILDNMHIITMEHIDGRICRFKISQVSKIQL